MTTPPDPNSPKKPYPTSGKSGGTPSTGPIDKTPPTGIPVGGGAKPGIPVGPKPGTPAEAKPGTPAPGKPVAPKGAKPGIPAGAKPGTSPAGKPAVAPGKTSAPAPGNAATGKPASKPVNGEKAPSKPSGKPVAEKGKLEVPVPKRITKASAGKMDGMRKLGQVLVDLGFVDEDQLWEILDESKGTGSQIGQVAMSRGLITEEQLYQALGEQFGLRVVNLQETKPTPEAVGVVPETMASVYKVLPLTYKDNVLTVVMSDPNNLPALDDLRNFLNIPEIQAVLAPPAAMAEATTKAYAGKEESLIDLIKSLEDDEDLKPRHRETSIDLDSLMEIQESAPVRKLLNMVMLMGIKDHASDIHFEPFEDEYKIRMKVDGVLYEMVPPPRHLANAIATRIKVMANLDIAERRLPQDGRIELNVGGNPVDLRVSILPTLFGESCVIRVLDRTVVNLDLNKIGMEPAILEEWRRLIHRPNGIVLVTGPTGSGKTTTLYASLNELNEITDKVITTEDPIEYDIDGIIQVPINAEIGVTFAAALRAILRQDPDIILVGEIRDLETAQIAVQAALTGHVVFSTLHTNDAPSTITRLRDMGVESFLITATVQGILAQRLVRRICEDCRTEFDPSDEMLMELNLKRSDPLLKGKKFYYGRGCDRCNNTGHRGRSGLFELVALNDELRDMITQGASTDQLREACRRQGMTTLRESGLHAIFNGITTIEEVVHETVLEDE